MTITEIFIPTSLDAKQVLRLRRFGLAALAYPLAFALVAIAWAFGVLPTPAALLASAAFVVVNMGLYLAIRSGFNLRFGDPSLTRFQILIAITLLMYIVYCMDDGRNIALFGGFIVFLFGIFRLNVREFTVVTLYALAAYALIINLLMHFRPAAIHNVHIDWMSWLMLAGSLPCFTFIGGHINALRRSLRDNAEKLRLFADNVPAMTTYWDEGLRCRFANRVFTEFWGHAAGELIGRRMSEIYGDAVYREVEGHALQALRGHAVTYQRIRPIAGGEPRYLEVRLVPQIGHDGKVPGFFAVTTDITDHKLAEDRIQRIAHHDSLTGLPNRLLFNDRLEQVIGHARRNARQVALLYLDLDRFKPVNDTLGHSAGDELLKSVAERIRRQIRESDTVARIGGDEFTVILPDIAGRGEAQSVARKIADALARPFQLGARKECVAIGTSVGVALYPSDASGADALVIAADTAMYAAKQAGRGVPAT